MQERTGTEQQAVEEGDQDSYQEEDKARHLPHPIYSLEKQTIYVCQKDNTKNLSSYFDLMQMQAHSSYDIVQDMLNDSILYSSGIQNEQSFNEQSGYNRISTKQRLDKSQNDYKSIRGYQDDLFIQQNQFYQQSNQLQHNSIKNYSCNQCIALKKIIINQQKQVGCICKHAKCLKYYCKCFRNNQPCTNKCKCLDCQNKTFHNKHALKPALIAISQHKLFEKANKCRFKRIMKKSLNRPRRMHCRCTKSQCQQKYCICFLNNRKCSSLCSCVDCQNNAQHRQQHSERGPINRHYECRDERNQSKGRYNRNQKQRCQDKQYTYQNKWSRNESNSDHQKNGYGTKNTGAREEDQSNQDSQNIQRYFLDSDDSQQVSKSMRFQPFNYAQVN